MDEDYQYDVALSFAGEDRTYVEQVAKELRARGIRVFYDGFEEASLWGKDLYVHLREIYQFKARFTIVFASASYARKAWPSHERESAQARALSEATEYILPARFDDTEIPGLLPTTGYIDLRHKAPEEFAQTVSEKLQSSIVVARTPDKRRGAFRTRMAGDRIDRLMVPFSPPTGVNLPPNYQLKLNGRAAEIRLESAAKDGDRFRYPVQLAGGEQDLHNFIEAVTTSFGVSSVEHEIDAGEGELWFEYQGDAPPRTVRALAQEHDLRVIQCGATLLGRPPA